MEENPFVGVIKNKFWKPRGILEEAEDVKRHKTLSFSKILT